MPRCEVATRREAAGVVESLGHPRGQRMRSLRTHHEPPEGRISTHEYVFSFCDNGGVLQRYWNDTPEGEISGGIIQYAKWFGRVSGEILRLKKVPVWTPWGFEDECVKLFRHVWKKAKPSDVRTLDQIDVFQNSLLVGSRGWINIV